MALAEELPPDASTASTGLSLRYIGKEHCYAYSGLITDNDSGSAAIIALDFFSGSGYIDTKVSILSDEAGASALYIDIELNDLIVFRSYLDASSGGGHQFDNPFYMIIPPFTHFVLKVGANSTVLFTAMLTGRVYDA